MGTRHLVCVVKGGKYKVAQYGQLDGYPSECGVNVLNFLLSLDTPAKRKEFKKRIGAIRCLKGGKRLAKEYFNLGICDISGQIIDCTFEANKAKYPWIASENSYDVLHAIMQTNMEESIPVLRNDIEFAGDSLYCEWVYVIDLDARSFEVFKGGCKIPAPTGSRFVHFDHDDNGYFQVRPFKWWSLNALPTAEQFLASCSAKEKSMNDVYRHGESNKEYYRICDENIVDGMGATITPMFSISQAITEVVPEVTPEQLRVEAEAIMKEAANYPDFE